MASKKIGGNDHTKTNSYIIKILEENSQIRKYEAPIILKAFCKTVLYFFNNVMEFEIKNVFSFKKIHKKESVMYLRYKDEYYTIPEHDEMKIKVHKSLKDYLNKRKEFKDVRRREILPDNILRTKNLF